MSDSTFYPFSNVVSLLSTFADGSQEQFSGSLISPDEILTVSHGLYKSSYGEAAVSIAVSVETNFGTQPIQVATTSSFHYNAITVSAAGDIALSQTANDYALIHVPGGVHLPGNSASFGGLGVYPNFGSGTLAAIGYPAYQGGALVASSEAVAADANPGVLDVNNDGAIAPGFSGGAVGGFLQNDQFLIDGLVSTTSTAARLTSGDIAVLDSWLSQDGETPFLDTQGRTPPDPIFNAAWYLQQNPDVAAAHVDAYQHYMNFGWHEGRDPSPYFHTAYYLNQNPDVAASGVNPLTHFETSGFVENRDPSVSFGVAAYEAANPSLKGYVDPLLDFLNDGLALGRMAFSATPHTTGPTDALVDPNYYFGSNADVATAGLDPTAHYNQFGWHENRNPDALFDTAYYLAHNPDVAAAGINPMLHYEMFGWHEGRNPSAQFDTNAYLAHNPDVAAAGIDPLVHYLHDGAPEGRAIYAVPTTSAIG